MSPSPQPARPVAEDDATRLSRLLDKKDPSPTFHTATSLLALGLVEEAIDALDLVVRQCEGHEARRALGSRARAQLELVRERVASV